MERRVPRDLGVDEDRRSKVEIAIEEWKGRRGLLDLGLDASERSDGEGVEIGGKGQENQTGYEYEHGYDEMLKLCWSKQECWNCLATNSRSLRDREENSKGASMGCSWCPSSQTCVPNPSSIHLLAPFRNADICPLFYERWELRTRPLGCHVSTITIMAVVVAVLSTMLVLGLVAGFVVCVRRWNRESRGRWKIWRWGVVLRDVKRRGGRENSGERRALLGDG